MSGSSVRGREGRQCTTAEEDRRRRWRLAGGLGWGWGGEAVAHEVVRSAGAARVGT